MRPEADRTFGEEARWVAYLPGVSMAAPCQTPLLGPMEAVQSSGASCRLSTALTVCPCSHNVGYFQNYFFYKLYFYASCFLYFLPLTPQRIPSFFSRSYFILSTHGAVALARRQMSKREGRKKKRSVGGECRGRGGELA